MKAEKVQQIMLDVVGTLEGYGLDIEATTSLLFTLAGKAAVLSGVDEVSALRMLKYSMTEAAKALPEDEG